MSAKKKKNAKSAKKPVKKAAARKPAKKAAARKSAPRAVAKKASGPQICHWEIQSTMPEKLHGFYSEIFGWKIDANNPMNYGMVSSGRGAGGIDGGIGGSMQGPSRVLVYANVKAIDPVLSKIESLGGKTLMPRTDVGPVIMALYADPEGNVMGVIEG
jgi:hypothetical protein